MAATFTQLSEPTTGDAIQVSSDGRLSVPDQPIVPFIDGDGTGPDIWRASQHVLDAAVARAYGGKRRIAWFEVFGPHGDRRCERERLGELQMRILKQWDCEAYIPISAKTSGDDLTSLPASYEYRPFLSVMPWFESFAEEEIDEVLANSRSTTAADMPSCAARIAAT